MKVIHVDMDQFFAGVKIRKNPRTLVNTGKDLALFMSFEPLADESVVNIAYY